MTQQQPLAHLLATQVEVAVAQPHLFVHLLVELKRQRLAAVQDLELLAQHFDLTRLEAGVGGAGRPRPHQARDLEHELIAHAFGHREHRRLVRIEDDLQQALAIAQIDENHAAVVAAALRPAGHGDNLAGQRIINLAAIMSAHRGNN